MQTHLRSALKMKRFNPIGLSPMFAAHDIPGYRDEQLPLPEEFNQITTTKYLPGITELDHKLCANWDPRKPNEVKTVET